MAKKNPSVKSATLQKLLNSSSNNDINESFIEQETSGKKEETKEETKEEIKENINIKPSQEAIIPKSSDLETSEKIISSEASGKKIEEKKDSSLENIQSDSLSSFDDFETAFKKYTEEPAEKRETTYVRSKHQRLLQVLKTAKNVPMEDILYNIIENWRVRNEKAIKRTIKKLSEG